MQAVDFLAVRFGCAADGKSFACNQLCVVQSASVLRRAELARCAADSKSFAVQPIELCAVRFGFAAGRTDWMRSGRQEACRTSD